MIVDLYRPGATPLHRLGAGRKLAALALAGTLLFLVPSLALSGAALGIAVIGTALTLGPRHLGRSLRAILPVVLLVGGVQLWFGGWPGAALYGARLAALLLLAGLVTATTRPSGFTEAIERAAGPILRPLGIDPARVGLAVSLAIRFVPVLANVAGEIREAQAARGLDRSVVALGVPLTLRTLKMADEIAEAIDARS